MDEEANRLMNRNDRARGDCFRNEDRQRHPVVFLLLVLAASRDLHLKLLDWQRWYAGFSTFTFLARNVHTVEGG